MTGAWTHGPARDQVGAEHDAAAVAADLGVREARRVAVGVLEPHRVTERRGARAVDELEPAALLEQRRQRGDERRAIARVRAARALPRTPADDEARIREQEPRRAAVSNAASRPPA